MNAFLIDPVRRSIEPVEIDGSIESIRALIGFPHIDADEIAGSGDRLYLDEECYLRSEETAGRFQLDTLAPVSGRGVVTGTPREGGGVGPPKVTLCWRGSSSSDGHRRRAVSVTQYEHRADGHNGRAGRAGLVLDADVELGPEASAQLDLDAVLLVAPVPGGLA